VEKITSDFTFLSYCLDLENVSLVFVFPAESEMNFEMFSEMETGTAQSCRSGNRIKEK
jgi:hypothetical protein